MNETIQSNVNDIKRRERIENKKRRGQENLRQQKRTQTTFSNIQSQQQHNFKNKNRKSNKLLSLCVV